MFSWKWIVYEIKNWMQIMFSLKRDIMAKAYHFNYTKLRKIIYNLMPIENDRIS